MHLSGPGSCVLLPAHVRPYLELARAGFRRQSTYRLAVLAGVVTNIVFGVIRAAILFAAVESVRHPGRILAPHDQRLRMAVEGLLGAVAIGTEGSTELSDRVPAGARRHGGCQG